MDRTPQHNDRLNELAHRASLYEILSTSFLFPDEKVEQFFRNQDFAAEAEGGNGCALAGFLRFLNSEAFRAESLTHSYNKLFHLDGGLSLYEAEHRCQHEFQKAETLADLMGFYHAFGVEPNGERPDHVSTELDFMRYLLLKEALALQADHEEHLAVTVEAEQKFFHEHLERWVPQLLDRVSERVPPRSFYAEVATLLRIFLRKETLRLSRLSPTAQETVS